MLGLVGVAAALVQRSRRRHAQNITAQLSCRLTHACRRVRVSVLLHLCVVPVLVPGLRRRRVGQGQ